MTPWTDWILEVLDRLLPRQDEFSPKIEQEKESAQNRDRVESVS